MSNVPLLSGDCIHKICEGCQNLLQKTFRQNLLQNTFSQKCIYLHSSKVLVDAAGLEAQHPHYLLPLSQMRQVSRLRRPLESSGTLWAGNSRFFLSLPTPIHKPKAQQDHKENEGSWRRPQAEFRWTLRQLEALKPDCRHPEGTSVWRFPVIPYHPSWSHSQDLRDKLHRRSQALAWGPACRFSPGFLFPALPCCGKRSPPGALQSLWLPVWLVWLKKVLHEEAQPGGHFLFLHHILCGEVYSVRPWTRAPGLLPSKMARQFGEVWEASPCCKLLLQILVNDPCSQQLQLVELANEPYVAPHPPHQQQPPHILLFCHRLTCDLHTVSVKSGHPALDLLLLHQELVHQAGLHLVRFGFTSVERLTAATSSSTLTILEKEELRISISPRSLIPSQFSILLVTLSTLPKIVEVIFSEVGYWGLFRHQPQKFCERLFCKVLGAGPYFANIEKLGSNSFHHWRMSQGLSGKLPQRAASPAARGCCRDLSLSWPGWPWEAWRWGRDCQP